MRIWLLLQIVTGASAEWIWLRGRWTEKEKKKLVISLFSSENEFNYQSFLFNYQSFLFREVGIVGMANLQFPVSPRDGGEWPFALANVFFSLISKSILLLTVCEIVWWDTGGEYPPPLFLLHRIMMSLPPKYFFPFQSIKDCLSPPLPQPAYHQAPPCHLPTTSRKEDLGLK